MIKRTLGAVALILGSWTAAGATDLLPGPVDPPANPWDGFYVGGHAGYGWANRFGCFGGSFPASHTCSPPQFNYNQTGWLAGGQTGYNMVMGSGLLVGLEVSASLTGITGNLNLPGNSFDGVGDWKYLGTATARLGWGNDKFLVYAEGGLGLGGFEYNSASCNFESNHQGWVYGAGVEAMVSGSNSIFVEYNHFDFKGKDASCGGGGGSPAVYTKPKMDVIKVGFNHNFN